MKNLITTTTVIIIFSANIALGEAEVVWQIGKTDRDYRDLAFPGNFNKYQQAFPKDVNFVVGKSDPLKDFSAVHPGPADRWAGLRKHPFSIRFEMPAVTPGVYELQINLVDTHINAPPSLQASVNGKIAQKALARGAGERTILHPETGKAR
ncbi:MAG: hypothetical protein JSV03_16560, partial [Planctomycetota bacterium]